MSKIESNLKIYRSGYANIIESFLGLKFGCGMGPLLVLVSPCFRETVVVICKIVFLFVCLFLFLCFFLFFSFCVWGCVCSLNNLLQKNVIVFFFENQISKWRSFENRTFLNYFSHFLVKGHRFLAAAILLFIGKIIIT